MPAGRSTGEEHGNREDIATDTTARFCDGVRHDPTADRAGGGKSFLPPGLKQFQRRAPELAMLIQEAFLRGLSTRQVGRVVSTLTGEVVSAQTVSRLIRDLDEAVQEFHRAPLADEWAYLFLEG